MRRVFPSSEALASRRTWSRWDLLIVPLILVVMIALGDAFRGASVLFDANSSDLTVSLEPAHLPYYALRSMLRMLAALALSLVFTFVYASVAAKSRRAEKVMIPILDFLQSLPILGFLTVTTVFFLNTFRGNLLGLEAVSVFAIFTSQVWNMTFSFYHSLITTPRELTEAAAVLRLSAWQKFWKLEVPFATPGLVWNALMSMSGGWFFIVASEVISVVGRDQNQALPGLGAYISLAIQSANVTAMIYGAVALFVLILLYDQILFRPVVAWSERFKLELSESRDTATSWLLTALQRSRVVPHLLAPLSALWGRVWLLTALGSRGGRYIEPTVTAASRSNAIDRVFNALLAVTTVALLYVVASYLFGPGLGFGTGRALNPNPNLNAHLEPKLAQRFAQLGIVVGDDQTVYLSNVCAATRAGASPPSGLSALLASDGVNNPGVLETECARERVEPGRVAWAEVGEVALLGLATTLRVVALIVLASLFWTPIGVWIGLRPRVAAAVQPIIQMLAAFPSNLLFPVAVVLIARHGLNNNLFQSPLMVLGTQWYILFNVIAGTVALPNDLKEAAQSFGLRGIKLWRRLIIPGIFPAYVTGGITASGGSWNASIVSEVVSWGNTTLYAVGLGAYIALWSTGEFNPHVALGMLTMGLFVLSFNRLLWRPLYRIAEERYRLD